MNKDELRKTYLTKRLALTESEHHALSNKISDLFFLSVELSSIKNLHVYLPIEAKREPDTWLIINRIQKESPHIRLVIPRVNGEAMENIFFEGRDQLEKNRWKILEPKIGLHATAQEIDLVIVPLLAVDKQGHRIGYGRGYYDRFLKLCRPDCMKIGLSFFEPELSIEEKHDDDVLLNACLTPNQYYPF
jgi:5-formyltetrahydrofolate cyclo-ligase